MNNKLFIVFLLSFSLCFIQTSLFSCTEVLFYCPLWGDGIFDSSYDRIESPEIKAQLAQYGIAVNVFGPEQYPNNILTLTDNQIVIIADVLGVFQKLNLNGHEKKLYFITFQPPTLYFDGHTKLVKDFFGPRYYTMCDDLVDREGIHKIYFPGLLSYRKKSQPFNAKKFMVAIYSNKLSLLSNALATKGSLYEHYGVPFPFLLDLYRKSLITYFADKNIDLFGNNWNVAEYPFYKRRPLGSAIDKINCITNYKFVLSIENTGGMKGYVTCQLFDAMIAGSVPVYADFNNAASYVPKNCYIDPRDFDSHDALYEYLSTMSEKRYNEYLVAIKKFLNSSSASLFTIGNFISVVRNIVFDLSL